MLLVNLKPSTSADVAAILRIREAVAAWLPRRGVDLWQAPLESARLLGWMRGG